VLDAAGAENRILITEDRDFGEMVVRQRVAVQGMILVELDRLSNPAEAAAVTEVALGGFCEHPEALRLG
jgi:predicted nuclease of predicted toxin-antitoxin system